MPPNLHHFSTNNNATNNLKITPKISPKIAQIRRKTTPNQPRHHTQKRNKFNQRQRKNKKKESTVELLIPQFSFHRQIWSSLLMYAVVTGANKGIGFEICRQLASQGVLVILGARNEKRGLEALEKLKGFGLAENVVFHQLDVVDNSSIASLAEFIKTKFGRLDILVNNAGLGGVSVYADALGANTQESSGTGGSQVNWNDILTQSFELAKECLNTNYYGVKRMTETFIPLLQLSKSPRIVNVSSTLGKLKNLKHEWAKAVLSDGENLTEEKIEEVINQYLKDFKEDSLQAKGWPVFIEEVINHSLMVFREDSLQAKGWPVFMSAYVLSKAALNAYSRVLAKKYPSIQINSVCPGFVKTDLTYHCGILSVEEGAESLVRVALQPDDGPSGLFFDRKEVSSVE